MSDIDYEKIEKIKELRELSGCSVIQCRKALSYFDYNINQAYKFLELYYIAVYRKKSDGTQWTLQDYIDYVKNDINL